MNLWLGGAKTGGDSGENVRFVKVNEVWTPSLMVHIHAIGLLHNVGPVGWHLYLRGCVRIWVITRAGMFPKLRLVGWAPVPTRMRVYSGW
jgi:hypothetical protein